MLDSTVKKAQRDWRSELNSLAFAYGGPQVSGRVKATPEDFRVTENLEMLPSGSGEHYWLRISKTKWNTDQLARELSLIHI